MTNVAKTYSYFSADSILARQYTATSKETRSMKKIVLDTIRQTDPEKADALKKQLDDTEQVIAQLRSGRNKTLQSIKAEAAEKIRRIKEQIKLLMMMGGDPKMIARQIAQLSKDLASATRSYSSALAGGTSSPDNMALADAETITSSDNTISNATQSYSTAELTRKAAATDADRQFAQEVRALATLLKSLIRKQKLRLHKSGDYPAGYDLSQASHSLAEAEKTASGMVAPHIYNCVG